MFKQVYNNWLLKSTVLQAMLVFCVLYAPLACYYGALIESNDLIQYLTLASAFKNGEFSLFINHYWSPLFPFLTGVVSLITQNVLTAEKCTQALLSFLLFLEMLKLLAEEKPDKKHSGDIFIKGLVFVPIITVFAVFYGTPDVLFVYLILLFYRLQKTNRWVGAGVVAGFAFLTRANGLVLLVLYYILILIVRIYQNNGKRSIIISFSVFAGIIVIWITFLSFYSQQFIFPTTTKFNAFLAYSDYYRPGAELTYPFTTTANYPLVTKGYNAWYNPVFTGKTHFSLTKLLTLLLHNLKSLFSFHFGLDTGSILVLVFIIQYFKRKDFLTLLIPYKGLIVITVLNTILFLPFFIMPRYVFINFILIAVILIKTGFTPELKKLKLPLLVAIVLIHGVYLFKEIKQTEIFQLKLKMASINYGRLIPEKSKITFLENTGGEEDFLIKSILCYHKQTYFYGTEKHHKNRIPPGLVLTKVANLTKIKTEDYKILRLQNKYCLINYKGSY